MNRLSTIQITWVARLLIEPRRLFQQDRRSLYAIKHLFLTYIVNVFLSQTCFSVTKLEGRYQLYFVFWVTKYLEADEKYVNKVCQ